VIAITLLSACASEPCEPGTDVGDCLPELVLPDRDGQLVSSAETRSDLLLVELSALW
jgi:hypothetical protein